MNATGTAPVAASISLSQENAAGNRLPVAGLLALAMASFITVLTEALPAGLLPQMSAPISVCRNR